MKLPTEQECLDLFKQYKVSNYFLNHCLTVREFAVSVAEKLKENGKEINIELVDKLALLHDLFKMAVIKDPDKNKHHPNVFTEEEIKMGEWLREKYPGMNEEEIAELVLKEDYPELAEAIRNKSHPKRERTYEEFLVHYADWKSQQDKIVALSKRREYLLDVYPYKKEKIDKSFMEMTVFEDKLKELGIDLGNHDRTYEQSE